jgi:hypothetical protein
MTKYIVQSGRLTVAVCAETAYDAAIEALQWWGADGADVTSVLTAEVTVSRAGSMRRGARFSTFEMQAHARGENPQVAWRRRLGELLEQPN